MKKKLDFSKYKTYDTSNGFGSPDEWISSFGKRMNYKIISPIEKEKEKGLCDTLNMAKTYEELRNAYYDMIKKYHPDSNGDTEDNKTKSQILNDTFFELKKKFK